MATLLKQYELVYIASPESTDEQLAEIQSLVETTVTKAEGTVDNIDAWGRRKLAYKIGPHSDGIYTVIVFSGTGELVKEIDRRLKVSDLILRQLIVRVDDELKKAERAKTKRAEETVRRRVARGLPPEPTPEELLAKQAQAESRFEDEGGDR